MKQNEFFVWIEPTNAYNTAGQWKYSLKFDQTHLNIPLAIAEAGAGAGLCLMSWILAMLSLKPRSHDPPSHDGDSTMCLSTFTTNQTNIYHVS